MPRLHSILFLKMLSVFFFIVTSILQSPLLAQDKSSSANEVNVPSWVADAIFYQIFPERFANGDTINDPPNTEMWGGTPKTRNYFGGDLKGVINHLDYLEELGINALYFNPIFESSSNHKYHTKDYLKIDDNFGDDKIFKQLLDECHRRGIRIVIDGVFNHTGVDFFAFEDIKKNEVKSQYLKWFNIHSFPVGPPEKPNYEAWWGLGELPKLMTDNADVRQHLFDVTRKWTSMGIDGWRLDVPNEMSHDFWIEWRKLVKSINPDCYIVGEIWEDASKWLQGDQFDAVMNYLFRNAVIEYIIFNKLTAEQFDSVLATPRKKYPSEIQFALQNLFGSHDTERYLSLAQGDVAKVKLTVLFQMTYLGAPMIYYGDEIGMMGWKDPDCRRTMIWDQHHWNHDLLEFIKKVIRIRKDYPVFRRGTYRTIVSDNQKNIFGFIREYANERGIVLLNNTAKCQSVELPLQNQDFGQWEDVLNGGVVRIDGRVKKLIIDNIPPFGGAVLVARK
ncbi:MAG TPA: glycoside hydrolase family 13 protein [Bacteroidota bacterium]|nr:glycoside hydrolase family 13 protein [Bacteroidota bacterium]